MPIDASFAEDGYYSIWLDESELLRLPIISVNSGAVACEFTRLGGEIDLPRILQLIREELLERFLGGDYNQPVLELVDLDSRRWSRAPFGAPIEAFEWTSVKDALPPGLEERETDLEFERPVALELAQAIDGYRFKLQQLAVSADGRRVATSHGESGAVWIADLTDGSVVKLPRVGGRVVGLTIGHAGVIAVEPKVEHLHYHDGNSWVRFVRQTGPKLRATWSPDGRELAVACIESGLRVFSWPGGALRLEVAVPNGCYGVAWSPDQKRIYAGGSPFIDVLDSDSGESLHRLEGTQHFQRDLVTGPGGLVAAGLFMKSTTVFGAGGEIAAELPNASTYGLSHGGFMGPDILVTGCFDGLARVWHVPSRELRFVHPIGKREPLGVAAGMLVARNPDTKRLELYRLPRPASN